MADSTRPEEESRSGNKKVLLLLLLLILLVGAGVGGYYFIRQRNLNKQQKNYEDLKNKAFAERTVTPTAVQTPAVTATTAPTEPVEEPSPAAPTEALPTATPTPTPTPEPTAEEILLAALMEEYESYFTILPDFNILHEENEDVFAYIAVPDTIIDYPILASEVEDYYLNHNIDGTKGYPGCLYIQNCNNRDLNDGFTIIYGHNMKNGTMFGSLKNYKTEDFRISHPYFFVYTEDRVLVYEIVLTSHFSTEHLLAEDYVKKDGKWVFDKFDGHETSRLIRKALAEDGDAFVASPEPTDDDTILVLSTCGDGKRYGVVGRRVLEVPVEEVPAPQE